MEDDLRNYIYNTLPTERWFATKTKEIADASLLDSVSLHVSGFTFLICKIKIDFEQGSDVYTLFLMESVKGNSKTYENALGNSVFVNYLYNIFQQSASQNTETGTISGENLEKSGKSFSKFSSIKLHTGEQSNSSIILDRNRIMKVYRRKTDYLTPDYQLPKAFRDQSGFRGTPECFGAITYRSDSETELIATIFQYVNSQGDCWEYFTRALNDAIENSSFNSSVLSSEIKALGKLTAEMHNSLVSLKGDNFVPVPLSVDDLSSWLTGLRNNAILLSQYSRKHPGTPNLDSIERYAKKILSIVSATNLVKTRIHGDYHLGQILKSENGFYVIDFEGEPLRSLEYRRLRQSPAKDVAGMLRSIHYAASYCTMNNADPAVRKMGKEWASASSGLFTDSYIENVSNSVPYMPEDKSVFRNILDFFTLDKALYEFNYELNNRPTWVNIPLEAIKGIMESMD